MKRILSGFGKKAEVTETAVAVSPPGPSVSPPPAGAAAPVTPPAAPFVMPEFDGTPEKNVRKAIKGFCESGGPSAASNTVGRNLSFQFTVSYNRNKPKSSPSGNLQQGEEVLYLPTIVDSAESSPKAAQEAATTIKKFLSIDGNVQPYMQYNAIMLMRILADNPGQSFTKHLDGRFAEKVKDLLKYGRDPSVRQLLAETCEHFENSKKDDINLSAIRAVWAKQKANLIRHHANGQPMSISQMVRARQAVHVATSLPPLEELVGRISEAQMSAKLLHQVLGTTPRNEILDNDLIREFVHRCRSASTSMADFITCDSPPPDADTLQTLIETNDILRMALARFDAIKESIDMANATAESQQAQQAQDTPSRDIDNPFSDPIIPPPLVHPGNRDRSRTPQALPRIQTRQVEDESPVSPVSGVSTVDLPTPPHQQSRVDYRLQQQQREDEYKRTIEVTPQHQFRY